MTYFHNEIYENVNQFHGIVRIIKYTLILTLYLMNILIDIYDIIYTPYIHHFQ